MLGGLFSGLGLLGLGASAYQDLQGEIELSASQRSHQLPNYQHRLRQIETELDRLCVLNQALWELIRERLNLRDEDLARFVEAIEERQGASGRKRGDRPLRCPSCSRVSNSRYQRCLYCGQEFERPLF